jgi:hypothetical protein
VFSRRFRGGCLNLDEVHGTLMARRQFPTHFTVGTDPDKKVSTFPRDRPTDKDKGRGSNSEIMLAQISVCLRFLAGMHVFEAAEIQIR